MLKRANFYTEFIYRDLVAAQEKQSLKYLPFIQHNGLIFKVIVDEENGNATLEPLSGKRATLFLNIPTGRRSPRIKSFYSLNRLTVLRYQDFTKFGALTKDLLLYISEANHKMICVSKLNSLIGGLYK